MMELYEDFFALLRFVKSMYDSGLMDPAQSYLGSWRLEEDSYWEITYEAISQVFSDTRQYYNEGAEIETWIFADPMIDQFCRLCQEYERRSEITEEKNPFRRELEQIIRRGFSFGSYDYNYNWRLSAREHGRRCLILLTGCEFYCHDAVPEGLLSIRDGFLSLNQKLEAELNQKEAA